jgi:hypothetical protein
MAHVNISLMCGECSYCKYVGDIMVGSISSGGPEPSYECSKGWNLGYHYQREIRRELDCDDYDPPNY